MLATQQRKINGIANPAITRVTSGILHCIALSSTSVMQKIPLMPLSVSCEKKAKDKMFDDAQKIRGGVGSKNNGSTIWCFPLPQNISPYYLVHNIHTIWCTTFILHLCIWCSMVYFYSALSHLVLSSAAVCCTILISTSTYYYFLALHIVSQKTYRAIDNFIEWYKS